MTITTITPSIDVTIGGLTRLYHAYLTTATASLDAPATLTLYAGPLCDISGFAADPTSLSIARGKALARLVLVDSTELAWQRARYKQHGDQMAAIDPGLVGLATLQQWLWQRLRCLAASTPQEAGHRRSAPPTPLTEAAAIGWSRLGGTR